MNKREAFNILGIKNFDAPAPIAANPYALSYSKRRHPFLYGVLLFIMIMLSILGVIFLIIIFSAF